MLVVLVGFLLDKKIGVNQPKRLENVNILIANTGMDTDKIKVLPFLYVLRVTHHQFFINSGSKL